MTQRLTTAPTVIPLSSWQLLAVAARARALDLVTLYAAVATSSRNRQAPDLGLGPTVSRLRACSGSADSPRMASSVLSGKAMGFARRAGVQSQPRRKNHRRRAPISA